MKSGRRQTGCAGAVVGALYGGRHVRIILLCFRGLEFIGGNATPIIGGSSGKWWAGIAERRTGGGWGKQWGG